MLCADGEPWGMDDEVISRLVEDAIDSESREVLTMSRSRSVYTTWSTARLSLEPEKWTELVALAKTVAKQQERKLTWQLWKYTRKLALFYIVE